MNGNQIQGLVKTTSVVLGLGLITSIATSVQAETLTGLALFGGSTYVYSFDSSTPGTLIAPTAVGGLGVGEALLDIGYIGNTLYGVGNLADLYTINPNTGAATAAGSFGTVSGLFAGADFTSTGIRIVTSSGNNLLINPTTGSLVTGGPSITPTSLSLTAVSSSSGGTMYAIDSAAGNLDIFNPIAGTASTVGSLGFVSAYRNGFDISPATGTAYFASASSPLATDSTLYTINLGTGAATAVGSIGPGFVGLVTTGLTVAPVPEPGSLALLVSGLGGFGMLVLAKRRSK